MAQLYFKYGAMGSSKTANALMTRFNYEERGQKISFRCLMGTVEVIGTLRLLKAMPMR